MQFTNITPRDVSSIPTIPGVDPGVLSAISSQVQSAVSEAATAASSIGNEAQSAVSSGITAIETAVDSIIPQNCTLGVKDFCIGFTDHVDCKELPLSVSNIIPSSVTAIEPSNLKTLDQVLAKVTPRSIIGCLAVGLFFAILTILPDVIYICSLFANELGLISFSWFPQIFTLYRIICSSICFVTLLAPTIILYGFLSASTDLTKEITIKKGEASKQVLVALSCAICMGISITLSWFLACQL